MPIYVDTYNDLMFHDEGECRNSLEQSFLDNELETLFTDYPEETRRMIIAIVYGVDTQSKDVIEFANVYEEKLESFTSEYMQEIDEEEAKDYEAGGCDWGD